MEWISQLAETFEIHVYSERVEDLDLSKITWHRVPALPGPHLFKYLWWFAANRIQREWDRRVRGLRYDVTFSPGVNCLDADAMSVHIVFAEYWRRNKALLTFGQHPVLSWPRLLHRRLYYSLIISLERRVYGSSSAILIPVAKRVAAQLEEFYGRREPLPVLYAGLDHDVFNPQRRAALREQARAQLGLSDENFAVLLIGNDWKNKGLPALIGALIQLRGRPIHLLAVGAEDAASYRSVVRDNGIEGLIHFLLPRKDVEFYYAAADAYAGPSLEDAFGLPIAEAMACGLPVIVSAAAGASEIFADGEDGLILHDPKDAATLAKMILRLYEDREFRERIGSNAAATSRQYTWERNGRELDGILQEIMRRKANPVAHSVAQEL